MELMQNSEQKGPGDHLMGASPAAYATNNQYYRDNVEPRPVYEVDGGHEPAEFDANREIGELPTNTRGVERSHPRH